MTSSSQFRVQKVVRAACGTVFLGAGAFKLLVPFGDFLAKMGVPLPHLAGSAVALLEITGGATLLFHRRLKFLPFRWRTLLVRLLCLGLAVDMIFAIGLVGVPGKRGHTYNFSGHEIGGEIWRLPLEIFLLLAMIWFIFRSPVEND